MSKKLWLARYETGTVGGGSFRFTEVFRATKEDAIVEAKHRLPHYRDAFKHDTSIRIVELIPNRWNNVVLDEGKEIFADCAFFAE